MRVSGGTLLTSILFSIRRVCDVDLQFKGDESFREVVCLFISRWLKDPGKGELKVGYDPIFLQ